MKSDRLFQIIYILLEKQRISAPELANRLEVSVRTIYRDIETLSLAGIPVYASVGKGGGISLLPGYNFDKSLLTNEEINQILFALQSMQVADQSISLLINKLGTVFHKSNINWIEVDFSRWGLEKTDNIKFERLKNAILEKYVLHILYCGTSGVTGERDIKPLKLIFKDKNWYLQAFCQKAKDFRTFKINRIIEMSITKQQFQDEFTCLPEIEIGNSPTFESVSLKLKFSPQIAFRVYDEFELSSIEKHPDGSILVTSEFLRDDWLYSYLLSFGTEVEVLEPLFIKDGLLEYVEKIYNYIKT